MLTGKEDMDPTQWLELFQPFTHVKEVRVKEVEFAPSVAQALVTEAMATGVLPELSVLYLHDFGRSPGVSDAAEQNPIDDVRSLRYRNTFYNTTVRVRNLLMFLRGHWERSQGDGVEVEVYNEREDKGKDKGKRCEGEAKGEQVEELNGGGYGQSEDRPVYS
ncbi:hypothetical protein BGY98DRAFT_1103393 [Russula aff. rugulosa BPL654]|nr:hypothetical protein BGY98DRAFT_1103393 [Russula aff. rugulosa BPL654]